MWKPGKLVSGCAVGWVQDAEELATALRCCRLLERRLLMLDEACWDGAAG